MAYTNTDAAIVNRALQTFGTRTTVTATELNALSSNEAIQANLIYTAYRDQLLRMAPWNCGTVYENLAYITSVPGTPENTSPSTNLWTPGQPAPPFSYEYLYPDDCLRELQVIPSTQTGYASGVPITTAVTGIAASFWSGAPIKFKVALDRYFREPTGAVTIVNGGTGYAVNDTLICGGAPSVQGAVPAGLINIIVTGVSSGVITSANLSAFPNLGRTGLLYSVPTYSLNQVSSSGVGTGAQVSIATVAATTFSARTILTNQEYATCAYIQQVTDPNIMDPQFLEAWINALGSGMVHALTGDKQLANMCIGVTNQRIAEARKTDGNEGLTINDVTPDFILSLIHI